MSVPREDQFLGMIHALKSQLMPQNPAVLIQQGDKIIPLHAKDIALFYTENEYSFAYTFAQESFLLSPSLEALSQQFSADFFRINRQFLVNRVAIKDASHHLNRKIMVNLKVPFKVPILVGKLKVTAFLNWWAGK
ncbi:MAG: LytTR family transcriptional regulator DNA-binding domain-containing protein [Haliscomenobacter sp.]|nr:LytTR family DNA-binding domain-containing protein [Haliscomenobacter sp.]MBK9490600.1 LytTR family transcriptional regulator DNA-binding domain-containing protein [Haliscomenobacter sp.]